MKSQRKKCTVLLLSFVFYVLCEATIISYWFEMLSAWGEMECNRELNVHGYLILCYAWNQLTSLSAFLLLFSVNRNFVLSTHVIWLTNKLIWFTRKFHSKKFLFLKSLHFMAQPTAISLWNWRPVERERTEERNPNGSPPFWTRRNLPFCRGFAVVFQQTIA